MELGTIIKWLAKPGDEVKPGQILFEVETDKAVVEVEADNAGRLAKIIVNEGESIAVKEPVAYLAQNDADVDAYLDKSKAAPAEIRAVVNQDSQEAQHPSSATALSVPPAARAKASPAAKKMATEHTVDLKALKSGSGPGGRILSTDVAGVVSETTHRPAPARPTRSRMSKMRRAIAANLQLSKQTIPHFYMRMTLNAGLLRDFCNEQKARYSCGINDVIVAACARVIRDSPMFRSRIEDDELVEFSDANIGIAVSMEEGLTVPVLLGAQNLTLEQIAAHSRRIIESARAGKLEGSGQGVFTISNLGMFGVEEFCAIINPPETAILGVGAAREGMVVNDGAARIGWLMTVTLSCDHRVIDGVAAAKFLASLKQLLEVPGQSLLRP